jgi:murein DD-endopeptidase MepM/ murein hydrolase activator NlpD
LPADQTYNAGSLAVQDVIDKLDTPEINRLRTSVQPETLAQTYRNLFGEDPRMPLQLDVDEPAPLFNKPFDQSQQFVELGGIFGAVNSFFDHDDPSYNYGNSGTIFTGESSLVHLNSCSLGTTCYASHDGIDYNTRGLPVSAAAEGTVRIVCSRSQGATGCPASTGNYNLYAAFGNFVVIEYASGYQTLYGHLDSVANNPRRTQAPLIWQNGDAIQVGERVGITGYSGLTCRDPNDLTTCPNHLHFSVIRNGRQVDPFGWWGQDQDSWEVRSEAKSYWAWKSSTITDDRDPSFESFGATDERPRQWSAHTGIGIRDRAWSVPSVSNTKRNWAIWGLRVPSSNPYAIQVYIPSSQDHRWTNSAQYSIRYRDATGALRDIPVILDQSQKTGNWYTLKRNDAGNTWFDLIGNTTILVILSDVTSDAASGRRVVFDAVRLFGLSATATGNNSVQLNWTSVGNLDTGYRIFRDDTLITNLTSGVTSHNDNNLKCGTTYRYTLSTYNANGNSDSSNTVIVTTGATNCNQNGDTQAQKDVPLVGAIDPNDKIGPVGTGVTRVFSATETVEYTINFENVVTATAPVQELVVVDDLDPNLDWTSLQLIEIVYGNRVMLLPGDARDVSQRDLPTGTSVVGTTTGSLAVDATVTLNSTTGRIEWRLKAIDTATGQFPEDPLAGFLPPENGTGRGQGHVSFLIKPKPNTAIGTRITNKATITFDTNNPIVTNEVWNTIGIPDQKRYVYLPLIRR